MTAPIDYVKSVGVIFSPKNRKGGLYDAVPSDKIRTNQN